MKKAVGLILTVFSILLLSARVDAVVTLPFSDSFEGYSVGSLPPSPWMSLDFPAAVTNQEAHTGTQSLKVWGGPSLCRSAVVDVGIDFPDLIGYEAWFKVNGGGVGAYLGFFEQIYNEAPQYNVVIIHHNGNIYFRGEGSTLIKENYSLQEWHKARVELDYGELKGNVWIDDELVGENLDIHGRDASYRGVNFRFHKIGFCAAQSGDVFFDDLRIFTWQRVPRLHFISMGVHDLGSNILGWQVFTRGDLDAEAVYNSVSQFEEFDPELSYLIKIDNSENNGDGYATLVDTILEVEEKVAPGDTFLFFFSNHGWTLDVDGGETTSSPGDEYIDTGMLQFTDDELYTLLSSEKWEGVNKIVIIQACHSGGFWGNNQEIAIDNWVGDLERLENVGLIASADEDFVAFGVINWRSLFGLAVEWSLTKNLLGYYNADSNFDGHMSFEELANAIKTLYPLEQYYGKDMMIMDSEFGNIVKFDSDLWRPASFSDIEIGILTDSDPGEIPESSLFMANIQIRPETLNLKSKGRWVTCYIELPEGLELTDIDRNSISITEIDGNSLEPPINALDWPYEIDDHDGDGVIELMVKFPREPIQSVSTHPSSTVVVEFSLNDVFRFWGFSTLKIIEK